MILDWFSLEVRELHLRLNKQLSLVDRTVKVRDNYTIGV